VVIVAVLVNLGEPSGKDVYNANEKNTECQSRGLSNPSNTRPESVDLRRITQH
jgi:hypothetical protein